MRPLSEVDLMLWLDGHREWGLDGARLVREWRFADFAEAMAFVNRVAELAERLDHHPDIHIGYDRVRLLLTTHSAGGISRRDMKFAEEVVLL